MDNAELEQHFTSHWSEVVKASKDLLDTDDRETVETNESWNSVLSWLSGSAPRSVNLIRPALDHLHDFADFFQSNLALGLNTSYLWGSLVCLLRLVSRSRKLLDQVPRMVKSFALKAGAFNGFHARSQVISRTTREVCFDMQVAFTDFLTGSIRQIRYTDEHAHPTRDKNMGLHERIQICYTIATEEIDEALKRLDIVVPAQESSILQSLDDMRLRSSAPSRRCNIPPIKIRRRFDRNDVFDQLDELLTADGGESGLQSVVLHGIGGVGKSSIASSYAKDRFTQQVYDFVLWIAGEKDVSLRQSFTNIAMELKLPGTQPHSHEKNRFLVQDWFQSTDHKWLTIFDNVESAETLAPYWPRFSPSGRAIVTTRNHLLAFESISSGIEINSWNVAMGAEFLLFLLEENIGRDLNAESNSARILSKKLSGHALAISQMAGLIRAGPYSVQEFTTMYLESPREAHALNELTSIWDFAFGSLDNDSFALLGIISFLEPETITPEIFEPKDDQGLSANLAFLKNKLIRSFAIIELTTRALIKRERDTGVLTVHRLIQTQFRCFLNPTQRQKAFNDTVMLVSRVIPESAIEKGQLYDVWEPYNKYMQHVLNLRDIFEEERKSSSSFKASKRFCEMLCDYQRFLYETCDFEECEKTCTINRAAVSTLTSEEDKIDLAGRIMSHQAQVDDLLGKAQTAIDLCQQEIDIRLGESPQKQIILAYSKCNLGIFYSSKNDFAKARECFEESRNWWQAHCKSKGEARKYAASILVYEARCMIGLSELSTAREMLSTTIAQAKEEKPLNFGTLAYAYFCLGLLERRQDNFEAAEGHFFEAQNTWLKENQIRQHPLNAGIMYKIGVCCLDQGKVEASIKHIRDSLEVTKHFSRTMPAEHARNLFKLSEAMHQNGDESAAEAEKLRDQAESLLKSRDPGVIEAGTESAYDVWIPIDWK